MLTLFSRKWRTSSLALTLVAVLGI